MPYFVHFIDDDPVKVHGPYELMSAKQFARIGSQYGGRRAVTRGKTGPVVRVYERGHRRWPRGAEEVGKAKLSAAETPRVLEPRVPKAIEKAWSAPQGLTMVANPSWSRGDSKRLNEVLATMLWGYLSSVAIDEAAQVYKSSKAAQTKAMALLSSSIPASARTDAQRFMRALKRSYGTPWWEYANEKGLHTIEEIAYTIMGLGLSGLERPAASVDTIRARMVRVVKTLRGR